MALALAAPPTTTDTISQDFFIEALTGSQEPISYLDRFPDSVYTKALDSLLVKFMYTLLGPVGTGLLRQEYLEARLAVEMAGLQTIHLDELYANAFGLARLAEETYTADASASLLPSADRAKILASDASYRNRAISFLKGARGGSTKVGLTLVAQSGLNRPAELIENYENLFDRFSDIPLGLPYLGQTLSPSEVIVVPRQSQPSNSVQTLTITGHPTQGWFTMTYPVGQLWFIIPVTTVSGNATITVPDSTRFPAGSFVTLTNLPITATAAQLDPTSAAWNNSTLFAQSGGSIVGVGGITDASVKTSVSLVQPLSGTSPGSPATAPSTGSFMALVGVSQTVPIAFNASAAQVQNALTSIPLIGTGNVICTGGPLPDHPVQIQFSNQLSDRTVPTLQMNMNPDKAVGITAATVGTIQQMSDIYGSPLDIASSVSVASSLSNANGQPTTISPEAQADLFAALDQTRPLASLFTAQLGTTDVTTQIPSSSYIESSYVEVKRYVTGRSINWPPVDDTHWIEPGVEHEAPTIHKSWTQYQGFHEPSSVQSYTELALADPQYGSSVTMGNTYWDSLIGNYSQDQLTLYPGLTGFNSGTGANHFLPSGSLAPQPEPLIISTLQGQGIINNSYPVDYMSQPGVPQPTGGLLWASAERAQGIDYLEVDLGSAMAVNYLSFEATNKPYSIDVAYDVLDQAPHRRFVPVTFDPTSGSSITSLYYQPTKLWETVMLNFYNSLARMVYTRFIRIGFTKLPANTVYGPVGTPPIPYSIEIRNLRIGRNTG